MLWLFLFIICLFHPLTVYAQPRPPRTPLPQKTLDLLANEVSGQIVYNNEVLLAGAPWVRNPKEFSERFFESSGIYDLVRGYGIDTVRLDRFPGERDISYPLEGEFWVLKPRKHLIARLDADPALIASGSASVDVTGELIYIPPLSLSQKKLEEWKQLGTQEKYAGKIALMWSHPRGSLAQALDAAGLAGVVSFNSRERYFDPDQVVYSRGQYSSLKNLNLGLSISWRQWSELLEDVEQGLKLEVRCKTRLETYPDKFETVFAWIPGSEPDKKGVIFTGHLFEGYTKRGANDNMNGCVVQLEILRALTKLIREGVLPQPRRTIYFLWPNEISGTYVQIKENPDLMARLSANINMDMVGEGLRMNNSWLTMNECPDHLPSYLDGLAESILNYVWRTNDIVYLPDSMRGRPGGQYFPLPMVEKNGSLDAFRYFSQISTGGSDHICFINPSVGIPAIDYTVWPDQWYHADTDTPDKSDPTQMKRTAFIGAAMAWTIADCSDEVFPELLNAVSSYGYRRIAKRELPLALGIIEKASGTDLPRQTEHALNLTRFGVEREIGALQTLSDIHTGSPAVEQALGNRIKQWESYAKGLRTQILEYGAVRAGQLKVPAPKAPAPTAESRKYSRVVPAVHPDVKYREFYLERTERFGKYLKENPQVNKKLRLSRAQQRSIQNFINGRRSITNIRRCVEAQTGQKLPFDKLMGYLGMLKDLDWVTF